MKNRVLALACIAVLAVAGGTAEAAPSAKQANIVQTAVAAGKFTTLAKLLQTAGLAGTLTGKGPFTVFAPTDAAFAKLPKATLNALAKDKAKLREVLLLHVASGKVLAKRVTTLRAVETLNGQSLRIRMTGGTVRVGGAKVTQVDVLASNGVIHVIDRVLIPS